MNEIRKPLLAITMGDPAGIGPEIAVRALTDEYVLNIARPVLIGKKKYIQEAAKLCDIDCKINSIKHIEDAAFFPQTINVYELDTLSTKDIKHGEISAIGGEIAFQSVKTAIELAMAGDVDGTVTAPINKEALLLAGHHFAGHTEIYAEFTKTKKYSMLLAEGKLRVIHVSTHTSLRNACDMVKKERVLEVIRLAGKACIDLGISNPKIAVAGLNPHAGENGLFGDEEIKEIGPAIQIARTEGWDVSGPWPPDSVFSKAAGGMFDIVVAMYHDQGHIPLKMLGFSLDKKTNKFRTVNGVNITIGLPIIRTSVDHGTAFDIAWKGIATPESLITAIDYAVKLVNNSSKTK